MKKQTDQWPVQYSDSEPVLVPTALSLSIVIPSEPKRCYTLEN